MTNMSGIELQKVSLEMKQQLVQACVDGCRACGWTEFVGGVYIEYEKRHHYLQTGFFCKDRTSEEVTIAESNKIADVFMKIVDRLAEKGIILMRFHFKHNIVDDDTLFLWHVHDEDGKCIVSPTELAEEQLKEIFEIILNSVSDDARSGPDNSDIPNNPRWC